MKPRRISILLATVSLYSIISSVTPKELVFVQAIWRHGDRAPLKLPYPKDPYTEAAWQRGWAQLTNPRRISILLATVSLYSIISSVTPKELVFVQAIWRHGDRAPLKLPYPKDPYTEAAWQRGWAQLTNVGMNQLNELGRYFRFTYNFFVSKVYNPSEVYIRSSDSDRALTSAQAFTSGFYPANGSFQWQAGDPWQPIPIHANSPGEPDLLTKPTSIACKKYDDLVDAEDDEQAKRFDVQYSEMFKILGEGTGIANFSYKNINKIYDVTRELIHNMTAKQPSWVFKYWPQYNNRSTMDIITELRTIRMITKFNSTEKANFYNGMNRSTRVMFQLEK
ncbi:histidine acid phosphatase, partial [Ostertagia ostertagi]